MVKHGTTTAAQLADEIIWAGSSPHLLIDPANPPSLSLALAKACNSVSADDSLASEVSAAASELVMRSHFLGPRFEQTYETACRIIGRYLVQQANLQVMSDGQTLGEFDLILGKGAECVHQELAVKFYLGVPAQDGGHIWFGPGQRDRLDLKLQTLLHKQLTLSKQPAAVSALQRLGLTVQRVELVMKGYLFYPWKAGNDPCVAPAALLTPAMNKVEELLTPEHLRGYWLQRAKIAALKGYARHWLVMPKSSWLRPATSGADTALDFEACRVAVELHFADEQAEQLDACHLRKGARARPLMVCSLEQSPKGLVEGTRFFITPDDWADYALQNLGA